MKRFCKPSAVCSSGRDKFQKVTFAYDLNVMPAFNQLFGLAVLGAFFVPIEQGQILIADNEQSDLLANAGLNGDARACRDGRSFGSAYGQLSCKTGGMAIEWAVLVSIKTDALGVVRGLSFALRTFREVFVGLAGHLFRQQDYLCSRFRILSGIMVFKIQPEVILELGEAMPAIAFEFRPGLARDRDAVMPCQSRYWQFVALAGAFDSPFVKSTVLNKRVPLKKRTERLHHLVERGVPANSRRINPMKLTVEARKRGFRIDKKAQRMNAPRACDQSQAKLANGGCIRIGGLNVQCDKAKSLVQNIVVGMHEWGLGSLLFNVLRLFVFRRGVGGDPVVGERLFVKAVKLRVARSIWQWRIFSRLWSFLLSSLKDEEDGRPNGKAQNPKTHAKCLPGRWLNAQESAVKTRLSQVLVVREGRNETSFLAPTSHIALLVMLTDPGAPGFFQEEMRRAAA